MAKPKREPISSSGEFTPSKPKQLSMTFTEPEKPLARKRSLYDTQNLEAAQIIMDLQDEYGGMNSGLVMWAKATIEKAKL